MPIYIYTAKDEAGDTKVGNIEASEQHDLAAKLRKSGLFLVSSRLLETKSDEKKGFGLNKIIQKMNRVSLVDKMMFTRNLSIMIKAGLPINQSLKALSRQANNPKFKKIIGQIEEEVRRGEQLSVAMTKHSKVFNELYINMIQVGETAGNLEDVLKNLAEQMRKDHDLVSRIRGAMIYPIIIIIALIGVGATTMIIVVPKLTEIFIELNVELPMPTKIVVGISNFARNHFLLGILIIIASFLIIKILLRNIIVKRMLHRIYFYLPIFGNLIKKINSARFARTFSSLINSGVDIAKSLQIVSNTLGNVHFKESLKLSSKEIIKGQDLSKTLSAYELIYPPMVIEMIKVGEETGNLSGILENLADFYEDEIDQTTQNLSAVIEPVVMVVIGSAIGFFAVAMLQPMYSMMQGI